MIIQLNRMLDEIAHSLEIRLDLSQMQDQIRTTHAGLHMLLRPARTEPSP